MGAAKDFLDRYPALRQIQASEAWRALQERYALRDDEPGLYVVRGDTVGDADDLLVDALARGSTPETLDPLARRLFEELPVALQGLVLRELRHVRHTEGA